MSFIIIVICFPQPLEQSTSFISSILPILNHLQTQKIPQEEYNLYITETEVPTRRK